MKLQELKDTLRSQVLKERPAMPRVGDKWDMQDLTIESQLDRIQGSEGTVFYYECMAIKTTITLDVPFECHIALNGQKVSIDQ